MPARKRGAVTEPPAFLIGFALGRHWCRPAVDAHTLTLAVFARRHVVLFLKKPRSDPLQFGDVAKFCLWRSSEGITCVRSTGFPFSTSWDCCDPSVRAFGEEDLVA